MKSPIRLLAIFPVLLAFAAAAGEPAPMSTDNPFARPSALPMQMPPFDKIKDGDYAPALLAGMAEQIKEISAIAHNPQAPTFDNTIVAMERSGRLLTRVNQVFSNITSANTDPELDRVNAEMAPKLASHQDAIYLDPLLFARIENLYRRRDSLGLDAQSLRLLDRYQFNFEHAGAGLPDAKKTELRHYNEQLSTLSTQFQQALLKATNDGAVVVDKRADLDGLTEAQIDAAAAAAKARKLDGKWVITLQNTTGQPLLAQLKNRALRERIYHASVSRGDGGPDDTTALVAQIVKLRAQRAELLGYANHAAYVLKTETAGTPEAVNKMLAQLMPAAEDKAHQEAADMQALIDRQAKAAGTPSFKLEPWDWAFYAEQVRKARFDYDQAQVRPYFELEHVLRDGVFYAAHQLYGVHFVERKDLPAYRPDVRVFEVFNEDGTSLGLILLDYFARDNKQGGAWMNEYVSQSHLLGLKPVVANQLNIVKPPAGQPVLLTFDEVTTMFHEFGHALHGLFSNVEYPLFAGTAVPPDFVEYPSQYNEMWASDPAVLANYARNYKTGAPMPKALLDKVLAAQKFGEGFATTEYLAAAIVDQAFHQVSSSQAPDAAHVMAFEHTALVKAGADYYAVPPRYHAPYFAHIFFLGYDAAYYAYIWSDVLAVDTGHWFHTHGGMTRANGDYLRAKVLSRGYSVDPTTLFEDFYGAPPDVQPLLEKRGLIVKADVKSCEAPH
ncbi:MAG: M3 family metallopeptidase [Stenotrophobium sp.]